jgi:8-oxo-dGTP diphosphatase
MLDDTIELAAFTMVLLRCNQRYLMLQRSARKSFAPGKWTGIGGRVEPAEFGDVHSSALREIAEETGYSGDQVHNLTARRLILQQRPGHPVTLLIYFTGEVEVPIIGTSDEGTLHWLSESELDSIDIIDNTRLIIPELIRDMQVDPAGDNAPVSGVCTFNPGGEIESIIWSGV